MKKPLKPLEVSRWEDDKFVNNASVYKEGKTEGIALKTAKKYGERTQWRSSFWIQKDQDVNSILDWVFHSVKNLFSKFWGKELITKNEIETNAKLVQELRDQLSKREGEFKVLKEKFEFQQKELSLAQEVISNSDTYQSILTQFESTIKEAKINNKRIEEWVKTEINSNRWILGLDCEVKAKNKKVDPQTGIDLHIETTYGEDRVIEVKSPNLPIFTGGPEKRFNISSDFATALSELIEYLERTNAYNQIVQRGNYKIEKPIGRILAGFDLNQDEEKMLNEWNFHLYPIIKIITYNDLINNAKKEIELIKMAKKIEDKKQAESTEEKTL